MTNIQIALNEKFLAELSTAQAADDFDLARLVEEALHLWLARRKGREFEQQWLAALRMHQDDAQRAEDWSEAQAWSEL